MKLTNFVYLTFLILLCSLCVKAQRNFDSQAHRGGAGLMPENTVVAAKNALRLGCTIEMDVYMSKDSQLIVTHDPHIMSAYTLDPNGKEILKEQEKTLILKDMDYAEIRKYDIGSKAFDNYPRKELVQAYIPRFSELIDSAEAYAKANRLKAPRYNIQMGPAYTLTPAFREGFIRKMMDIIIAKKIQKRAMFQSFDVAVLEDVHRLYPGKIQISYLLGASRKDFAANLKRLTFKPDVYSPHYELATPELVEKCHKEGIKIIPWTVNNKKDIDDLRAIGVDGIITDYPDLL